MSAAPVAAAVPAPPHSAWIQRLPIALATLALFAWLLWSVSARQALLLLVGLGLGFGLARYSFGFTTAWRNLVRERDPSGVYGQIVLIGLLALASMPILGFFPETTAALGPPSWSVLIGAFLFGLAMQVADGCGSGTLYKAGMGIPLNMAVLPMFVIGSFLGSLHVNSWVALGSLPPVGLVQRFGAGPALALTLAGLALTALALRWWTGRGFRIEPNARHWIWGAIVLAIFGVLNLLIAGQPWGIVYGFGLWGAKAAAAIGAFDPAANAFWSDPGHALRLSQTLLLDVTSITDIGILIGAWWVAVRHPRATRKHNRTQTAAGLAAGLLLGYSSRLAFGCNIGAMVGGISSGSLHGWIWVPLAFLGSMAGLRIRGWLRF